MRYLDIKIVEALKPSEYRKLVKGWNKDRYSEIFLNPKYKHDRKGYRVYIPIDTKTNPKDVQASSTYKAIEQFLSDNGYHIVDYVKGIVQNLEKKQDIKIGKVLTKLKRQDLLNQFNTDKVREGTRATYMVVISRHPYDLGGMSTDRGWSSCMNLKNGINRHYVPIDIKEGSVIAYVTTIDDLNLQNPTGRVLLKPFVDILGTPVVYFGIENRTYGTNVPGFIDIVTNWANEINTSNVLDDVVVLNVNPKLYKDSDLASQTFVRGKNLTPELEDQIKKIQTADISILDIKNPSEILQIVALKRDPYVFERLMKKKGYVPSETVQRMAVISYGDNIELILDKGIKPSEAVQLAAVGQSWRVINTLLKQGITISNSVAELAVETAPEAIRVLIDAKYKINKTMLLKGLRSNGELLDLYIKTNQPIDLEIETAAVENGYTGILDLFTRYKDKGQQLPEILVDKVVKNRFAARIVKQILVHNQKSTGKDIIPLSEKQLVDALETSQKIGGDDLFDTIIKDYPDTVSENMWVELFKRITPKEYLINRLVNKNLITNKGIRQLLAYNGELITFIENPSKEEMYAAVENQPDAIRYIPNPSPELQIFAVKKDPNTIGDIETPVLEAFKVAASYKEHNVDWDNLQDGVLNVYNFLTMVTEAIGAGTLDERDVENLIRLLIKTEPHRIINLIYYDSPEIPVTEELQMIAVDKVPKMVLEMLDHKIIPSNKVLIAHVRKYGRMWYIVDKVARFNKYENKNIVLPDELFYAYLESDASERDPKWLLSTMVNNGFPVSKELARRVLEMDPTAITSVLANDLDVTPEQVFNAVKAGGVNHNDYTFLSAVQKKYGSVPEELIIELLKSAEHPVSRFLDITYWHNKNQTEPLSDRFYRVAIEADYRNMLLIKNPSRELRQFSYETNGYWVPLSVGDMVRVSNSKATPRYKIVGFTANGDYKIELDGVEKGVIPKDRIHQANGIKEPADYEEKQKLFAKKWGHTLQND